MARRQNRNKGTWEKIALAALDILVPKKLNKSIHIKLTRLLDNDSNSIVANTACLFATGCNP